MKGVELFELVHSLSKSEKRAFKLNTAYHKDQSLIYMLFDHICKLKKESFHLLPNKIKDEKLLKKLPRIKRDLYYRILDFLASYHEERLLDAKIYKQIRIATILIERNLYKQAWEQIIKAKKQAQLYEKYNHLLDALIVQTRIINKTEQPKKRIEKRSEFNIEINEALVKQQWLFEFEQLIAELGTAFRNNGVCREPKQVANYQKALTELPPLKFRGYRFGKQYELARSLYFNLLGDTENAYLCKKRLVEISDEYPHFVKIYTDEHVIALFNLMFTGIRNGLFEESLGYLEKLELFLGSCSSSLQIRYLPYCWDIQLACFNGLEQYDKSWKLVVEIEEELIKYQAIKEAAFLNVLSNNIIATCLFVQKYKKALDWVNKVLNEGNSTLRQDYYINIRFLECFVLIENDLSSLVNAKLRSIRAFLNKKNKLFSLEIWLLSFLHCLGSNAHNRKRQKELYKDALAVFKEYESSPIVQIFNYPQWINIVSR